MNDETRKCIVCGNEYKVHRHDQVTCGGVECMKTHARARKRIHRKEVSIKKEMQERNKSNIIIDISSRAKNEGLSYGQYVAKYGL